MEKTQKTKKTIIMKKILPLRKVTTVYKDVTERLKEISLPSYTKVQKILQDNKEERAVRGGMATRQKYLKICKINIANLLII